jgi:hypothetical protein
MTDHSWIRKIFKNKFTSFVKHKKTKVNTKLSLLPLEERLVPALPFVQTFNPFGVVLEMELSQKIPATRSPSIIPLPGLM